MGGTTKKGGANFEISVGRSKRGDTIFGSNLVRGNLGGNYASGAYVTLYIWGWQPLRNKGKQTAFILWFSLSSTYNSENAT